jgi:hypothetical protein
MFRDRTYASEPSKPPRFSTLRIVETRLPTCFAGSSDSFNLLLIPLRFRPLFRAYLDRSIFALHNPPRDVHLQEEPYTNGQLFLHFDSRRTAGV